MNGRDIGRPAFAGRTTPVGADGFDILAGGEDIWGESDQFHFASREVSGDFDCRVRVESLEASHLYTKAGIMARDGLGEAAAHVMHLVFPSNAARNNNSGGYESQYRLQSGGGCLAIYPADKGLTAPTYPVAWPRGWLRLSRQGKQFTFWYSQDGQQWTVFGQHRQDLPATLQLGLALTAHDNAKTCQARFRDFRIS